MVWNLLIGPGCLLLGILITLYVKDSARGIAKIEFQEQIGAALAVFKLDLVNTLDMRYRISNECVLMMASNVQRMDSQDKQEHKDNIRLDQQEKHLEFNDERIERTIKRIIKGE
jgi:hypothetical protein